jgi:hypothetical protein
LTPRSLFSRFRSAVSSDPRFKFTLAEQVGTVCFVARTLRSLQAKQTGQGTGTLGQVSFDPNLIQPINSFLPVIRKGANSNTIFPLSHADFIEVCHRQVSALIQAHQLQVKRARSRWNQARGNDTFVLVKSTVYIRAAYLAIIPFCAADDRRWWQAENRISVCQGDAPRDCQHTLRAIRPGSCLLLLSQVWFALTIFVGGLAR